MMKSTIALTGVYFLASAAGSVYAEVNYFSDNNDITGWTQSTGVVGETTWNDQTAHYNTTYQTASNNRFSPDFDTPVDIAGVQSFSLSVDLNFVVSAPANYFVSRVFVKNVGPELPGAFAQAWITTRRSGTTQLTVQSFHPTDPANNDPVTILDLSAPNQTFSTANYLTLTATRTSAGLWTVVRSDTGDTIMSGTESTVVTQGNLGRLNIFDNQRAAASEPLVYYNSYSVTSVPVPVPEWKVNADGNWSDNANWTGNVPNSIGAGARFGSIIDDARNVTVDVPITVGKIEFDNVKAYNVIGTEVLTLNGTSGASIIAASGSHSISAPMTWSADTAVNVAQAADTLTLSTQVNAASVGVTKKGAGTLVMKNVRANSLTIEGGLVRTPLSGTPNDTGGTSAVSSLSIPSGTLDVGNNSMVINYSGASPLASIRQLLASGKLIASGSGSGTTLGYGENSVLGLGSSFAGQPADSDSVLVKFTWSGDADFNGKVNTLDFNLLAGNFGSGDRWTQGDFNYDGVVDSQDFTALSGNFGQSGLAAPTLGSAVPEPGGLVLSPVAAILFRRRRRS